MENPAYEDSPLSHQSLGFNVGQEEEYDIVDKMDVLVVTQEAENTMIDDNLDYSKLRIENHLCKDISQSNKEDAPVRKEKRRKTKKISSKVKQPSLLKTALFRPYVDENNEKACSNENTEVTPQRHPLSSKNSMIFANSNAYSSTKKSDLNNARIYKKNNDDFERAKRNITMRQLSTAQDKENVQF